ncbi:MAG: hypothetical protein H6722_29380 [Sandaracinus sp.]|nr:hypothetical protein [Sandaracinus sp.]MCB9616567.1 hypothetical protein [Sandaracinus sp.]MCB9622495.1 hypothetical protein [Sandaracinus sp.]
MRRILWPALLTLALACGSEHADGAPVETATSHTQSATTPGPATEAAPLEATSADEASPFVRGGACTEDRDCNWMACGCRCRFFPRGARVRCPSCDEEEAPDCGRARCEEGVCLAPRPGTEPSP